MSKIRDLATILSKTALSNTNKTKLLDSSDLPVTTPGTSVEYFNTLDSLPTTNLSAGNQAFVQASQRFYISNGNGWYNVALVNTNPSLTISPSGAIALNTDGSTTTITLVAVDSDNDNLTFSVESDGSFLGLGTIVQDSSVFTITPFSEDSATQTSSTLTFKVTDGIAIASGTSALSLSFVIDWSTASLTETNLQASDIADGDNFGRYSSNLSGDGLYLIAGSMYAASGAGKAYIFFYNGSSWSQQLNVTGPDGASGTPYFGGTVAIDGDGDVAVIGQHRYDSYTGAAWVYTRSGTTWTQRVRLEASDGEQYDMFSGRDLNYSQGIGVSKDGTYIIIGARQEDTGASNAGSAYIYTGSAASWTEQAIIRSPAATASDDFGTSVHINSDGTYAIIGAKGAGAGTNRGAAYIYTRSGSTWSLQATLTASDGADHDNFGSYVKISGDGSYAVCNARYDDDNYDSSGSVYVFVRSGSSWSQQQKINLGAGGAIYNYFGSTLDMNEAGDLIVVGSGGLDTNQIGKARIYKRTGTTWALVKTIGASDDADTTGASAITGFASKVGMSGNGNVVAVSAYPDTNTTTRGSVYVYNES
tara:strand:+ start:8340 stop:10106 length:1767 start_codon:yes stop_codon:yes gene_type:complete